MGLSPSRRFVLDPRIARFFLVGVVNSLFSYGVFSLLVYAGLHFTLAVLASHVLGILFNFQTHGRLVFGQHDPRLLFRYFSVYTATYFLNISAIALLKGLGLNVYLAGAASAAGVAVVTFYAMKALVFAKRAAGTGPFGGEGEEAGR